MGRYVTAVHPVVDRALRTKVVPRLPSNRVRVWAYRRLGYRIGADVRIGRHARLRCESCHIGAGVVIASGTSIHVRYLRIGPRTVIGSGNVLTAWASYAAGSLANTIELGEDVALTGGHLLDGSFGIVVGDGTWLAGRGTELWTHGSLRTPGPIRIGRGCYVGSAVRIATGVELGAGSLVGLGSVVLSSCPPKTYLLGNPAVARDEPVEWRANWR